MALFLDDGNVRYETRQKPRVDFVSASEGIQFWPVMELEFTGIKGQLGNTVTGARVPFTGDCLLKVNTERPNPDIIDLRLHTVYRERLSIQIYAL